MSIRARRRTARRLPTYLGCVAMPVRPRPSRNRDPGTTRPTGRTSTGCGRSPCTSSSRSTPELGRLPRRVHRRRHVLRPVGLPRHADPLRDLTARRPRRLAPLLRPAGAADPARRVRRARGHRGRVRGDRDAGRGVRRARWIPSRRSSTSRTGTSSTSRPTTSRPTSTRNPVLHFWSLAVEEQFYLLWPLAARRPVRRRRGRSARRRWCVMRVVVVAVAVASALGAASRRDEPRPRLLRHRHPRVPAPRRRRARALAAALASGGRRPDARRRGRRPSPRSRSASRAARDVGVRPRRDPRGRRW